MHNLTPQQITIIGAAITFGMPIAAGFVVAHFTNPIGGMFAALVVFVVILTLAHKRLKRLDKNQNKE